MNTHRPARTEKCQLTVRARSEPEGLEPEDGPEPEGKNEDNTLEEHSEQFFVTQVGSCLF